jgi:hypothetical protein
VTAPEHRRARWGSIRCPARQWRDQLLPDGTDHLRRSVQACILTLALTVVLLMMVMLWY